MKLHDYTKLLLKADEVAHLLGVGRAKTYALLAANALPTVRIGRSVRVPAQALRAWVADRTQNITKDRAQEIFPTVPSVTLHNGLSHVMDGHSQKEADR